MRGEMRAMVVPVLCLIRHWNRCVTEMSDERPAGPHSSIGGYRIGYRVHIAYRISWRRCSDRSSAMDRAALFSAVENGLTAAAEFVGPQRLDQNAISTKPGIEFACARIPGASVSAQILAAGMTELNRRRYSTVTSRVVMAPCGFIRSALASAALLCVHLDR